MRSIFGLFSLFLAGAAYAVSGSTYYVSPTGNDAWSGRLPAPNIARTDGPLASLKAARDASRKRHSTTICLRGGVYRLTDPLTLGQEDSSITWTAYRSEKPVLSGGVAPVSRKELPNGHWELRFPSGTPPFEQLYVNGQRRCRPRLPKHGYFHIEGELPPSQGDKPDRFRFQPGEFKADWANLHDIQALCFHQWTMQRLRVASVDATSQTVTFTGGTWHPTMAALAKGDRFLIENVKEALSEPGEWYREPSTGVVTYIPIPGERIDKADITAPVMERVVEIRGAHNVTFNGITFAHTGYVTPPQGRSFPQAEIDLGAAIEVTGSRDCTFERCTIEHSGAYGIWLRGGSADCAIRKCRLVDLGAGGVKIGDTTPDGTERITVQDCRIAHGGRIHPAAIGVWIGQSPRNLISHNAIDDFYYTGVSAGWVWGYGSSGSHHNIVEYNVISRIGQGVLSDLGGIYTLGLSPGSVLRGNVIHDCDSDTYGGWGIYFDEGTSGMLAENNLVYHTKTGGFHQHYGENNTLRNNIFALSRESQIQRTRMEDHLSFTFERNIVYYRQGVLLGSNWGDSRYNMDSNLYWNAKGSALFLSHSLNEWQRDKGKELNSIIADPLFVDPEHGDFHLRPGSPASKIGFVPWDYTRAGPRVKIPADDVPAAFPVTLATYE